MAWAPPPDAEAAADTPPEGVPDADADVPDEDEHAVSSSAPDAASAATDAPARSAVVVVLVISPYVPSGRDDWMPPARGCTENGAARTAAPTQPHGDRDCRGPACEFPGNR
jgi:hypothetical protein